MKRIILLAFKFPPYDQVGSYRWSKFCKYLQKLGHQIDVVTVDWPMTDKGQKRLKEVSSERMKVHRIPSGYLHKLKYRKLKNKYLRYLRLVFFKILDRLFFFDDEAQRWGKYAVPYVEGLLTQYESPVLIATGAPFQSNLIAAKIKERNPELSIIQDMRDLWASNTHKLVSKKQRAQIRSWEERSIAQADRVVGVSQTLLNDMKVPDSKGAVIENGYDEASNVGPWLPQSNKRIKLIHIGSISNGRDLPLMMLLKAISEDEELSQRFEVNLIGNVGPRRKGILQNIAGDFLIFKEPMEQITAFESLLKADYALQLSSPDFPYALSTKIYEYGMLRVPTLSLNYGGEIEALMKESDLGVSINLTNDNLLTALKNLRTPTLGMFGCHIEQYSYTQLSQRYSNLINSL